MTSDFVRRVAPNLAIPPELQGRMRQNTGWVSPPVEAGLAPPEYMYGADGRPLNWQQDEGGKREFYVPEGEAAYVYPPNTTGSAGAAPARNAARTPSSPTTTRPNDLLGGRLSPSEARGTNTNEAPRRHGQRVIAPIPPSGDPRVVAPGTPSAAPALRGRLPVAPALRGRLPIAPSAAPALRGRLPIAPSTEPTQNEDREGWTISDLMRNLGISLPIGTPGGGARPASPVGEAGLIYTEEEDGQLHPEQFAPRGSSREEMRRGELNYMRAAVEQARRVERERRPPTKRLRIHENRIPLEE